MTLDLLARIKDVLSLTVKQVLIVAFASWTLLLLPDSFLALMGLADFRTQFRPWIGLLALISLAWLVALPIYGAGAWAVAEFKKWRRRKADRRTLESLSPVEKHYLKQYVENDTTTRTFRYTDGVAQGLESRGIIVRMSALSKGPDYFDYNIHPWAYEILKQNPSLLAGAQPPRDSR